MKLQRLLILAALALLTSCSAPGSAANDPMRLAMSVAAQGQMAAHQQASLAMAGRQLRTLAPMRTIPVMQSTPIQPAAR